MDFIQSISGNETIPIFNSDYVPPSGWESSRNYRSLKDIYNNIKTVKGLTGDYLLNAVFCYGAPYWIYRVNMIPITSDIHLFTLPYMQEHFNIGPSYNVDEYGSCIFSSVRVSGCPARNYNGSYGSVNNYQVVNFSGKNYYLITPLMAGAGGSYNAPGYPSYSYTPNWDSANGLYKVYFNEKIPIRYNYKAIDYIFGNGSTLKLSMIKEESTNGGENVEFTNSRGIQRFTDKSDLHFVLGSMPLNGTKILGYTDNNNYITLSKTVKDSGFERGVIKYYIDGVHQSSLDFEIYLLYGDPETEFHYYLSYLIDVEHKACRQSIIMIRRDNSGKYNTEENNRAIVTEEYQSLMFKWISTGWFTEPVVDPNEQGGTSNPGGGNGGYNNIGDDIPFPTKPAVSTVDADFITVYNPTLPQIKSLARYMWSGDFNLDSFKKIFTDPMDCIIGLHMLPCPIPINGAQNVKVGNLLSPVSMNLAANQFVDVDCGSIKIDEYWGSYLDYSPYTKIIIYLPYIGTQPLEVDDVMNKTVNVKYRVDIVTGACVCFIIVNGVVLYQFSGSCIATIPITSQDYKNVLTNIISLGIAGAGVASSIIATGGVSTPLATGAAYVAANGVMNNKPTIAHGNSAGGTAGFMSIQIPYITITRANQCLPKSQHAFTGYPSYTTKKLSTLTGFTQVEEIQLNSLSCTDGERKEIETLLKGGVII